MFRHRKIVTTRDDESITVEESSETHTVTHIGHRILSAGQMIAVAQGWMSFRDTDAFKD